MHARGHGIHFILLAPLAFAAVGMIACAIGVAILPSFTCTRVGRARDNDIPNIVNSIKTYVLKHEVLPDNLQALVDDQILDKLPKDPWGNDYRYTRDGKLIVVTSYGADGEPGGRDLDADISSTAVMPVNESRIVALVHSHLRRLLSDVFEVHDVAAELARDPWGRPYRIQFDGPLLVVTSFGADGAPGGDGFDADISSNDLRLQ